MVRRNPKGALGRLQSELTEEQWRQTVRETAELCGFSLRYHTRRSTGSDAGFPDEVFVHAIYGRVLFVELKAEGKKRTPAQLAWATGLERCPGVEYYCWAPSDWPEVQRVLRGAA